MKYKISTEFIIEIPDGEDPIKVSKELNQWLFDEATIEEAFSNEGVTCGNVYVVGKPEIKESNQKGEEEMILSEAKKRLREAGYRLVKEEIEDDNKSMFFRQPKRMSRAFTGIEDIPADIGEEMDEEEYYTLVRTKVKGMAELYQKEIDEDELQAMCFRAYDQGLSVKEAFKQIWIALKK